MSKLEVHIVGEVSETNATKLIHYGECGEADEKGFYEHASFTFAGIYVDVTTTGDKFVVTARPEHTMLAPDVAVLKESSCTCRPEYGEGCTECPASRPLRRSTPRR